MFRVVKCSLLIRNQPTKQTEQQQQKTPKKTPTKTNKQKNATIATTESRHYLVLAYWFCSFYRSFSLTFLSFDLNFLLLLFLLLQFLFCLFVYFFLYYNYNFKYFSFNYFFVPCGKFGSPYLGKAQQPQEQRHHSYH